MQKNKKLKLVVLLLLLVGIVSIGSYMYLHRSVPNVVANGGGAEDTSFVKNMTDEELKEYLQEKANKSKFRLKLDTNMVFNAANEVGTVNILNPASNQYGIRVQTRLEGQNKVIYDSGLIKPKQYVEAGELKANLKRGVYKTQSTVTYYELADSSTKIGETAVVGQLSVNN
jgi:hypothetical protein